MRCEMLMPELWGLLLLLPLAVYFVARTYVETGPMRKVAMGALRVLIVALVVAGLVRVRVWLPRSEQRLCVMALADVSESMPANTAADVARDLAQLSKGAGADRQGLTPRTRNLQERPTRNRPEGPN